MPRAPGQSDFVVARDALPEPVELPGITDPIALPKAEVRTNEASARSTKVVMTVMWILLAALVILCAVGPHIPAGE